MGQAAAGMRGLMLYYLFNAVMQYQVQIVLLVDAYVVCSGSDSEPFSAAVHTVGSACCT